MRDGPARRLIKALVRGIWTLELGLRRRLDRARGRARWRLGGACGGCAACCEAPAIRVGVMVWYLPTLRRLFLAWQRHINGFQLQSSDRGARAFVFRCGHFDPRTRRCDSYESRPFLCRDYPRALLEQPWPELFEGCGFRAVPRDRERQLALLEGAALPPERLAELRRRLRLD